MPNINQLIDQALSAFHQKNYALAEKLFSQLKEQAPDLVIVPIYLAQLSQLRQEGARWIKPLEEALTQHRESADGYYVLGHSYQQNRQLPQATQAFYLALNWRLQHKLIDPIGANPSQHKPQHPPLSAEALPLLLKTLAGLKQVGLHAFPTAGTLLGLERTGQLLPNDKDVDIGIDWSQMDAAIKHLTAQGWQEEQASYGLINPRCFRHRTGLVLDLCGYATEQNTGATISGLWMSDIPFDWNRITRFPAIQLIKRASTAGEIWYPRQPAQLLAALYGPDWQTPDAHFDTIVCAPNLFKDSWLYYCQAYARLYNAWQQEHYPRMQAMLQVLIRFRPKDTLLHQLTRFVEQKLSNTESTRSESVFTPAERKRHVLALGYFDLLHPGHLNYLGFAKAQGDYLTVGVAPDAFALKSKGHTPMMKQEERLRVVEALQIVDQSVLVAAPMADTAHAAHWIAQQSVNIVVCGAEWQNTPRWRALEDALKPQGIQVIYAPHTQGISSTLIKQRLLSQQGNS